ncbi:poliovirus receptor-like isoform 2-T2 [Urocitellus parryii]
MVSPPALLALLALSWATRGAGTGTVVVQAPAQVSGLLNGSLLLPCHLQPLEPNAQVTQVTWMRQDSEGGLHKVAVRHPTRGPSLAEPERIRFASADLLNASLRVSELRTEDQANYSCQFATFPMGSGIAWTWLQVFAKPQNTVEAQEVPLRPSTGEPVPVARCSSKGGRPPAKVTWSPFLNGSGSNTVEPGPLPGTYTVVSVFTLVPSRLADGGNITCRVEHESQEEPALLPVTLAVPYPPEVTISGYEDNWYVGQDKITLSCEARSNPEPTDYAWNTSPAILCCGPRHPAPDLHQPSDQHDLRLPRHQRPRDKSEGTDHPSQRPRGVSPEPQRHHPHRCWHRCHLRRLHPHRRDPLFQAAQGP